MKLKIALFTMVLICACGLSNLFAQWDPVNALPYNHHQYDDILAYEGPVVFNSPQIFCEPNGGYSVRIPYNHFETDHSICMVIQTLDWESAPQYYPIENCSSTGYLQSGLVNLAGGRHYQISFGDRCPDPHHPLPIFDQCGYQLYPPPPAPEYPDTTFVIQAPYCPRPFHDHYQELIAIHPIVMSGGSQTENPMSGNQVNTAARSYHDGIPNELVPIFPSAAVAQSLELPDQISMLLSSKSEGIQLQSSIPGHVAVSIPRRLLDLSKEELSDGGILHLPFDLPIAGQMPAELNQYWTQSNGINSPWVLLAGDYQYGLLNDLLYIEAVACTIAVQFSGLRMECSSGGTVVKFHCNIAPLDATNCVSIIGPGAPTTETPWTTNDFVSPVFHATPGATYSVMINYCGGYPLPNVYFPYDLGLVVAPVCRIVSWDNYVDSYNPHHQPNKTSPVSDASTTQSTIHLFPNPASNHLNIRILNSNSNVKEIQIYDLLGKAQTVKVQEANDNEIKLDISTLPSGTYFLQLTTSKGSVSTKRFQKLE
jgi:hypothetical protein